MSKDSITLSPKHGVNPSLLHCICCGKEYGVAMLGKLKGDAEAPRDIHSGLCPDCEAIVKQGGAFIIEVKDGETEDNPYRTGRLVGVSKDYKEKVHLSSPLNYMPHSIFEKIFGSVKFDNDEDSNNNNKKKTMYLKDGREIYESDDYPGYFIDANTGAFCDEDGNYVGGNIDNGDKPGISFSAEYVWITKTGKQYYPKKTKSATTRISLQEARREGYRPSKGYLSYKEKH